MTEVRRQNKVLILISVVLAVATIIAYEPIRHNDFVGYDDPAYVTENPNIAGGINPASIKWAFTEPYAGNWHPLTWLSHMLDYQIYGLKPLGHHITNLVLHIANSLLLFFLLTKMTRAVWKSAFVAAVFALHPLHVESVAWAAERKDVLSTFFWMLTILAYVHYVNKPNMKSYLLVILAFAMGLMSKPMVVTLPFVLILLDYWPLGRFENFKSPFYKLIYEKIPLFAMSAAGCAITIVAQKQGHAILSLSRWPFYVRIVNALGSYFNYAVKIVYPKNLAVLYPLSENMTTDAAIIAIFVIAILLIRYGQGRRWLATGLLWYLGTLVPVIGLVQAGVQTMADRYTYLPSIGLFIIFAWGAEEIVRGVHAIHYKKIVLASVAAAATVAMIFLTRIQVGYWRDSGALYKHTIDVTKNNYVIMGNYGYYLCTQGKNEEGMQYLMEVYRIRPNDLYVRENISVVLLDQKKFDEVINFVKEALPKAKGWPEEYKFYCVIGAAYEQKGDLWAAETNYRKALELKPDYAAAQQGAASVEAKRTKNTELRLRGN